MRVNLKINQHPLHNASGIILFGSNVLSGTGTPASHKVDQKVNAFTEQKCAWVYTVITRIGQNNTQLYMKCTLKIGQCVPGMVRQCILNG